MQQMIELKRNFAALQKDMERKDGVIEELNEAKQELVTASRQNEDAAKKCEGLERKLQRAKANATTFFEEKTKARGEIAELKEQLTEMQQCRKAALDVVVSYKDQLD